MSVAIWLVNPKRKDEAVALYKFLGTEFNKEPYDCLAAIEEYKLLFFPVSGGPKLAVNIDGVDGKKPYFTKQDTKEKCVKFIYDTWVVKEVVNIAGKEREAFDAEVKKAPSATTFKALESRIDNDFMLDTWARFAPKLKTLKSGDVEKKLGDKKFVEAAYVYSQKTTNAIGRPKAPTGRALELWASLRIFKGEKVFEKAEPPVAKLAGKRKDMAGQIIGDFLSANAKYTEVAQHYGDKGKQLGGSLASYKPTDKIPDDFFSSIDDKKLYPSIQETMNQFLLWSDEGKAFQKIL